MKVYMFETGCGHRACLKLVVATCQPCWTFEAEDGAHCLGVGSVAETGVGEGS